MAKLPASLAAVGSPLIMQEWTKRLAVFPDAHLLDFLLQGFNLGFHIGFNRSTMQLAHPKVVLDYLQKEL